MSNYKAFSVLGIEIEYMIVSKNTLDILPISDKILSELAGKLVNEYAMGEIALSNELVMHVLEFKNNGPKPPHLDLIQQFQNAILNLKPLLDKHNALLLPGGAHPWMNPSTQTQRWPHDNKEIYQQFDSIFDCKGHGWANLQSMHVNLPFSNDEEFYRLHNGLRLILPLIPALAASTPILDGKLSGWSDTRMHFYEKNQKRIPEISGQIIPEFITSQNEYREKILKPMYQAISPYDPQGILQHQWLNSRGVIPKFDMKALEIRVIDSQECVEADISIALVLNELLRELVNNQSYYLDNPYPVGPLKKLLDDTSQFGMNVKIEDSNYLKQWGEIPSVRTVKDLWMVLLDRISTKLNHSTQQAIELILTQGNLSERITKATGNNPSHSALVSVYSQLAHCLLSNERFNP